MKAANAIYTLAHMRVASAFRFLRYTPHPKGGSPPQTLRGAERIRALTATPVDPDPMVIPAHKIRENDLEDLIRPSTPEEAIAFCSHIGLDGRRQLLILDFSAPVSDENDVLLIEVLTTLRWRGWALHSGSSYLFIGSESLAHAEWRDRMAQALLLPVAIDRRFVGHNLRRGYGGARIWACSARPTEPQVLAEVS